MHGKGRLAKGAPGALLRKLSNPDSGYMQPLLRSTTCTSTVFPSFSFHRSAIRMNYRPRSGLHVALFNSSIGLAGVEELSIGIVVSVIAVLVMIH